MQFGEGGREGAGEQHLRRKDQELDREGGCGGRNGPREIVVMGKHG